MRHSIVAGAVIIAVLAYSIYWFLLASQTRNAIVTWTASPDRAPHEINMGPPRMGGYPFRLIARTDEMTSVIQTPWGALGWVSRDLRLVAEPWSRQRIHVDFTGDQAIRIPAGGPASLRMTAGRARATATAPGSAGARYDLHVETAEFRASGADTGMSAARIDLRLDRVASENGDADAAAGSPETEDADPALPVTARAGAALRGLSLPAGMADWFGREVEAIRAEVELRGRLTGSAPQDLRRWADAGGTLEVTGLALDWGAFEARAAGTLTIDDRDRPLGAFDARVRGLRRMIDILAERGVLRADYADLAQSAVAALEGQDDGGWVRVPVTLQNGYLNLGPIPLLALPAMTDRPN